jgi:hypothetical protein
MSITATHTEHHTTSARTLLIAVELSDKTWKLELLSMLMRYEQGERQVWQVVHVPSVKAEDQRHLHRDLETLKRERGGPLKCRACPASRRIDGVASSTVRLTPNAETHRGTRAC